MPPLPPHPATPPRPETRPTTRRRGLRWLGRRFLRDERASVTMEAVLILPIWLLGFVASVEFFQAYRTDSINLRAAYTISDMVSRELDAIGPTYLNRLEDVFEYLTNASDSSAWIRVTSVYYDASTSKYRQYWSYSTDTSSHPALTDTTVAALSAKLPNMNTGETVILMETAMDYTPLFGWWYTKLTFNNFVTTRPRFAAQISYSSSS